MFEEMDMDSEKKSLFCSKIWLPYRNLEIEVMSVGDDRDPDNRVLAIKSKSVDVDVSIIIPPDSIEELIRALKIARDFLD